LKLSCFDITKSRDIYNSVGNADSDSGSDSESESEKVGSPAKIAKVLGWFTIGCLTKELDI